MPDPAPFSTTIRTLGERRVASRLRVARFMDDRTRVLVDPHVAAVEAAVAGNEPWHAFEQAGPRRRLFFEPASARLGVLSAGGICPGINDVIRGLVMEARHGYGVERILGLRYGFDGLLEGRGPAPMELTPAAVAGIHERGGTVLGTGRGAHDAVALADGVERLRLDAIFCIGGDGSIRGAHALDRELARRGRATAVIVLPKTIDNDVLHCSRTFGFMTAVEAAARSIAAAHVEAGGHLGGIGLVKLMGRESGFIAASATLACPEVNFVLVPEVPFDLLGEHGLLAALRHRIEQRAHAVIVVAEGAGAMLAGTGPPARDPSGNPRLPDIGRHLQAAIEHAFAEWGIPIALKYIDPSYDIRAVPAGAGDKILCGQLAKMAVHAAMAGKTGLLIGLWNELFVHVPLEAAVSGRKRLNPAGLLWQSVLGTTGQPPLVAPS